MGKQGNVDNGRREGEGRGDMVSRTTKRAKAFFSTIKKTGATKKNGGGQEVGSALEDKDCLGW